MAYKILVVDDDKAMAALVKDSLSSQGYQVTTKGTAEDAFKSIQDGLPDLMVLDVGLPGFSGLNLCEIVRKDEKASGLLIILLTSQNQEAQKVRGLEAGADDYVTKPFSVKELAARVQALLRRKYPAAAAEQILTVGSLSLKPNAHEATVAGKKTELRSKEYALLELFMRRPGQVLPFATIAEVVWGDQRIVTSLNIKVLVHDLRSKLGPEAERIEAIPQVGYKLSCD